MIFLFLIGFSHAFYDINLTDTYDYDKDPEGRFVRFSKRSHLEPIVLVPGLAGSHLEYKNKTGSKWGNLWLDFLRTLPIVKTQYMKDLAVTYDPLKETYSSASHIESRPVDFGGLNGIDYLDPVVRTVTKMFHPIIKALNLTGYQVGKNLFGAPYDWRLANHKQVKENGMLEALKQLIEKAYGTSGNQKVHVAGHSCGCIFTRLFLTDYVTQEWKNKYIASFISISGPYSGSPEAFAHLMSPRKWAVPTLSAEETHEMVGTFGGIYWMLPNTNGYPKDHVLARIHSTQKVITIENMTYPFSSTGRTLKEEGVAMTQKYISHMEAPHVPVHLMYSIGQNTLRDLDYDGPADSWYLKVAIDNWGKGDGTVPIESLRAPLRWADEQDEEVTAFELYDATHTDILGDDALLERLVNIVSHD